MATASDAPSCACQRAKLDGYVRISFGSAAHDGHELLCVDTTHPTKAVGKDSCGKYETRVNLHWGIRERGEHLLLPIYVPPNPAALLSIMLMDRDVAKRDDIVGVAAPIALSELLSKPERFHDFFRVNLYTRDHSRYAGYLCLRLRLLSSPDFSLPQRPYCWAVPAPDEGEAINPDEDDLDRVAPPTEENKTGCDQKDQKAASRRRWTQVFGAGSLVVAFAALSFGSWSIALALATIGMVVTSSRRSASRLTMQTPAHGQAVAQPLPPPIAKEPTIHYELKARVLEIDEFQEQYYLPNMIFALSIGKSIKCELSAPFQVTNSTFLHQFGEGLPKSPENVPDIIITVRLSSSRTKPIAFARLNAAMELASPSSKPRWVEMTEIDVSRSSSSGRVLMQISLTAAASPLRWPRLSTPRPARVSVFVCQGRRLPAGDEDGLCDPLLRITFRGRTKTTTMRSKTRNPIWYQILEFGDIDLPCALTLSALRVELLDRDQHMLMQGSTDELLSSTFVRMDDVQVIETTGAAPVVWPDEIQFHELEPTSKAACGGAVQLAVSVQWASRGVLHIAAEEDVDMAGEVSVDVFSKVEPPSLLVRQGHVRAHVLGVRGLQPGNRFGKGVPRLIFEMKETIFGPQSSTKDLKASTLAPRLQSTDRAPNYFETVLITCSLPLNPTLAPVLDCHLVDDLIGGGETIIGRGYIKLGHYYPASQSSSDEWAEVPHESHKFDEALFHSVPLFVTIKGKPRQVAVVKLTISIDFFGAKVNGGIESDWGTLTNLAGGGATLHDLAARAHTEGDEHENAQRALKTTRRAGGTGEQHSGREDDNGRKSLSGTSDEPLLTFYGDVGLDEQESGRDKLGDHISFLFDELEGRLAQATAKDKKDRSKMIEATSEESQRLVTEVGLRCIARVYILRASQLVGDSTKMNSGSNDIEPYLRASLYGKVVEQYGCIKAREQGDPLNPEFFTVLELEVVLPGDAHLLVEVMGKSLLSQDHFLGAVVLDLEDRFYDTHHKYRKLPAVCPPPAAEVHNLRMQKATKTAGGAGQLGQLSLWIDVVSADSAQLGSAVNHEPPLRTKYEVRVIVYSAHIFKCNDFTGMCDLFFKCSLQGGSKEETDTHFRLEEGMTGSFNWRFLFEVDVPLQGESFRHCVIEAWDANLGYSNLIGDVSIDLSLIAQEALVRQASTGGNQMMSLVEPIQLFNAPKPVRAKPKDADEDEGDEAEETDIFDEMYCRLFPRRKYDETQREEETSHQGLKMKVSNKNGGKAYLAAALDKLGLQPQTNTADLPLRQRRPGRSPIDTGDVRVSVALLPKQVANLPAFNVGKGRGEPNRFPVMRPPDGRIESYDLFNPITLFRKLLGQNITIGTFGVLVAALSVVIFLLGDKVQAAIGFIDLVPYNLGWTCMRVGSCYVVVMMGYGGRALRHAAASKSNGESDDDDDDMLNLPKISPTSLSGILLEQTPPVVILCELSALFPTSIKCTVRVVLKLLLLISVWFTFYIVHRAKRSPPYWYELPRLLLPPYVAAFNVTRLLPKMNSTFQWLLPILVLLLASFLCVVCLVLIVANARRRDRRMQRQVGDRMRLVGAALREAARESKSDIRARCNSLNRASIAIVVLTTMSCGGYAAYYGLCDEDMRLTSDVHGDIVLQASLVLFSHACPMGGAMMTWSADLKECDRAVRRRPCVADKPA